MDIIMKSRLLVFLAQIKNMLIFAMPLGFGFAAGQLTAAHYQSWWGWLAAPVVWYVSGTILFYVLTFLFGMFIRMTGLSPFHES